MSRLVGRVINFTIQGVLHQNRVSAIWWDLKQHLNRTSNFVLTVGNRSFTSSTRPNTFAQITKYINLFDCTYSLKPIFEKSSQFMTTNYGLIHLCQKDFPFNINFSFLVILKNFHYSKLYLSSFDVPPYKNSLEAITVCLICH